MKFRYYSLLKKILFAVIGLIVLRTLFYYIPFVGWGWESSEVKLGLFLYRFVSSNIFITLLFCIFIAALNVYYRKYSIENIVALEIVLGFIIVLLLIQGNKLDNLFVIGSKIGGELQSYYDLNQQLPSNLGFLNYKFSEEEIELINNNFRYKVNFDQPVPHYSYQLDLRPTFLKYHYYYFKPWSKEFILFD